MLNLLLLSEHLGFKLISLELANHKILGTNKFQFVNNKDNINSLYFTVIIGANGTGKSELLKVLLNILRGMHLYEKEEGFFQFHETFRLKFVYDNHLYTYSNFYSDDIMKPNTSGKTRRTKRLPYLHKDDAHIEFLGLKKEIPRIMPSTIVANSIMLTDKFIVPKKNETDSFPTYKYLGVRYRPQQASTRYYVRKTVEFIVERFDSYTFRSGLKKLTKFLNFSNSLNIVYRTINTPKFFRKDIKKEDLDQFFADIKIRYEAKNKTAPYKLNRYLLLNKKEAETIDSLCSFIRRKVESNNFDSIYRSSAKLFRYNILEEKSHAALQEDYKNLELLRQLGFIAAPEIKLSLGNDFNLSESSSGEFHFFSTMVGLLATVKPSSLIIIDEPEISLHPNWQMKYLEFIRELFSDPIYSTCHIIMATHSHFLVSDLKGESSNIIGLKKEKNKINTIELSHQNTFGWSAEEVLYKVFEVRTTRNYYIEMNLRELLYLISVKSKNKQRISELIKPLEAVQLSKPDPLRKIINSSKKYLSSL